MSQCPFFNLVKPSLKVASNKVVQDIYEVKNKRKHRSLVLLLSFASPFRLPHLAGGQFQYEKFFREQILKKKADHTYRVFKKVARDANNFPFAKEFSENEKDIKVWCSNDYMGITTHPEVKKAIM